MMKRTATALLLLTIVNCSSTMKTDPGALVRTTSTSTVGVLLDEIPPSTRDRAAAMLIAKPTAFWTERAARQLKLTSYRLVFRGDFYEDGKKQLPLPPEPLWTIVLLGQPRRQNVRGHDLVTVGYNFSGVLLTTFDSPGISEPKLKRVRGSWEEPFVLPIDPDLLLQRTGFACMDEEDFPFPSVDSEEADSFYDQECDVEEKLSNVKQCHFTQQPEKSCSNAVEEAIGKVETTLRFERLPWDPALADRTRYGHVTGDDPDLEVYRPEFLPSQITYRYIHNSGCELREECVSGSGWRRLLQFATSDENVGRTALTIGGVDYTITGDPHELDLHNLFEFSPCHHHYHFKYYGDFHWDGDRLVNSKKGFCLQSTARAANREDSPLHNAFAGCSYQGVEAGWLDQYKIGLPCQWLDITDFAAGTGMRSFNSNPNGFLCEGKYVDADGKPIRAGQPVVWNATGLTAGNGKPVEAPLCQLSSDWKANNQDKTSDVIPPPGEGLVTAPCTRGQIGPKRNCGFTKPATFATCDPGQSVSVTMSLPADAAPQVVRICEYSHALSTPIPCRYEDSFVPFKPGESDQPYMLANAIVTASSSATVTFTCPSPRTGGTFEPGGAYSVYTAPVLPDDPYSALHADR